MKENLLEKTQINIFEIPSTNISILEDKKSISELDNLPDDWNWKKLGEIVKTIDGDRGSNYPKKNEFFESGYCLFLSTKNVREDGFIFDENIFISKEKDEILRGGKLQLNDVVITTRGTLGNVALYDEKVKYKQVRINSGMLILRISNPILNNYYLMKFITSPLFTKQLKEKQSGSAQPQIPANVLSEIVVPIPPILEQKNIVKKLDLLFEKIDKTIKLLEENIEYTNKLMASVLNDVFKELKENYQVKNLLEVAYIGTKKGYNPEIIDGHKVPFVSMSDIDQVTGLNSNFELKPYEEIKNGYTKFEKNSVLVAKITPCTENNKTTIMSNINGGFATTEVYPIQALESLNPEFLLFYLRSPEVREQLILNMI